ncbi:MAG TPA: hypothetical protein VF069_09170 [Streptosporangiaceae bacterium]
MVLTDVAEFSASHRTDRDRLAICQAQYDILRQAFADAGIPWDILHVEDRGDGVLLIVPPDVRTELLVHPFIDSLVAGLSRHNAIAEPAAAFQLRVAIDVGPVRSHPRGVAGEVIINGTRLVDASILKEHLRATAAALAFITSRFVYDNVVRQRPGDVNPDDYKMVEFWSKGSLVTGWMYLGAGAGGSRIG